MILSVRHIITVVSVLIVSLDLPPLPRIKHRPYPMCTNKKITEKIQTDKQNYH